MRTKDYANVAKLIAAAFIAGAAVGLVAGVVITPIGATEYVSLKKIIEAETKSEDKNEN